MQYARRIGEPSYLSTFERSDRLVIERDNYFYKTRECRLVGPFSSVSEAKFDLSTFVELSEIDKEIQMVI